MLVGDALVCLSRTYVCLQQGARSLVGYWGSLQEHLQQLCGGQRRHLYAEHLDVFGTGRSHFVCEACGHVALSRPRYFQRNGEWVDAAETPPRSVLQPRQG